MSSRARSMPRCRTSTRMRVDFSVPEQQIRLIAIGLPVTVIPEVGGTELRAAHHRHRAADRPELPPRHGARRGRQPRGRLNPAVPAGAGGAARGAGVIALPQTVLSSNLYGDSVFIVRSEGEGDAAAMQTVEQVFVKAGRRSAGLVEILERAVVTAGRPGGLGRAEPARAAGAAGRDRQQPSSPATARPSQRRRPADRATRRADALQRALHPPARALDGARRLHPAARLPGHRQPAGPPVPGGRGDGGHHHHHLSRRAARPDPGLHHRADRRRGRDDREHRLRHLADAALGQRGQRQHAARRRPRRGADRGAVQGAAGARPAARGGRGPDHRQGHRLRLRADVSRGAEPEHDPGAADRVPRAGDPAAHVDDRGRRRDRDHRRGQLRDAGLDRPAAARRARRDRRRGAGGDPRLELPLGAGQDRERVRRLQHHHAVDAADAGGLRRAAAQAEGDAVVRLRDVARVELAAEEQDEIVTFNGLPRHLHRHLPDARRPTRSTPPTR